MVLSITWYLYHHRKEGQDTTEELQKRNLREELDERERRHFSSKDKTHGGWEKTYRFFPFIYSLPVIYFNTYYV